MNQDSSEIKCLSGAKWLKAPVYFFNIFKKKKKIFFKNIDLKNVDMLKERR